MAKPIKNVEKKHWHQKWWGVIILIVLSIVAIYLAAFLYTVIAQIEYINNNGFDNLNLGQDFTDNFINPNLNIRDIVETRDDPFHGPEEANLVIVEFSDFQCPFCKQAQPIIKKIRDEYPDNVKIIYRDFPVMSSHPQSLNAAIAAECASEQDMFWQYHDELFANQANLSDANLKLIAQNLNLDTQAFNNCLDSQRFKNEVLDDLQDGIKAGITGTPTFFINGSKVPGVIPYENFKQLIDGIIEYENTQD